MAKGDVGSNLIYKPNNRACVLIEKDEESFKVRFLDDNSIKQYSMGSFGSKFGLAKQNGKVEEVKESDNNLLEENKQLKKQVEELSNQVEELSNQIEKLKHLLSLSHKGGRPRKFGDKESEVIEQMIYYRKQGESFRKIGSRFGCAASFVCRTLNKNKDKFIDWYKL